MEQVMREAMADPYDLLFGRKTYESFAAHWPSAGDNPIANKLNNATKFVVTSAPSELEWKNSVALTGDVVSRGLPPEGAGWTVATGSWQWATDPDAPCSRPHR